MARSQGARFLVRIEDLDPQRSRREYEESQLADLRALGIDWDEEPVRQSERTWFYDDALAKLHAQQRLYPCFCTRAEIREAASAPHGKLPEGFYPGTCRDIPPAERRRRIESGERFALRLRAEEEVIEFDDLLLGPQRFRLTTSWWSGLTACTPTSWPSSSMTPRRESVRSSAAPIWPTPRRARSCCSDCSDCQPPAYAHVPLVLGPTGERLAKRDDAATLADREEPVATTLALLAHSIGSAGASNTVSSASELLSEFDSSLIPLRPITLR